MEIGNTVLISTVIFIIMLILFAYTCWSDNAVLKKVIFDNTTNKNNEIEKFDHKETKKRKTNPDFINE